MQHECSPFDTHWYCDLAEELGGVFWDVQQQGIKFPGSEYFICHRGNDRQEGSIGVVRTARGQGGVLDIEQCRRRFSVATQIDSIFAEAPRYKPRRKRSTIEDNMTPTDAGTCRLPIDLQPIWDAGLKLAQDDLGLDLNALFNEGVALLSPRGVLLKPVLPPVDSEDSEDLHDPLFVDEDIDDHVLQATDEVEEQFAPPPILLDFEGQGRSKQYVLNVLHNDGTAAHPRDRLMRAIQGSRPGLPMQPSLNVDPESGPIVGDTFATLVWYAGKLSLGLFYLRTLSERGRNVNGLSAAQVESSSVVMCHGQLMSMQEYPGPKLYAWNGRLIQKVLKFKGQDCQFVKLRSNVDHMWYEQADRVIALTQEQLLTPPDSAPTLRIDPYPNLPFLDQNDETCSVRVGSAAPTSGLCEVCQKSVPLHSMRTHIGRHVLLGECARDVCGYCGGHDCTTQLLRNTQGRLVSVIVTNCPLEPTNVRYGAMARGSARNPCTNRPMQCVLCRDTVWLYGMAHHFDSKHAGYPTVRRCPTPPPPPHGNPGNRPPPPGNRPPRRPS